MSKDMVFGWSLVFTQETVVDETPICDQTIRYKTIVGIDASQLHPFFMCQAMKTGLYTRLQPDSEPSKNKPRQNRTRFFENIAMSCIQRVRRQRKVDSFHTTSTEKKFMLRALMVLATTYLSLKDVFFQFCRCLKVSISLTDRKTQQGSKRELYTNKEKSREKKKVFTSLRCRDMICGDSKWKVVTSICSNIPPTCCQSES